MDVHGPSGWPSKRTSHPHFRMTLQISQRAAQDASDASEDSRGLAEGPWVLPIVYQTIRSRAAGSSQWVVHAWRLPSPGVAQKCAQKGPKKDQQRSWRAPLAPRASLEDQQRPWGPKGDRLGWFQSLYLKVPPLPPASLPRICNATCSSMFARLKLARQENTGRAMGGLLGAASWGLLGGLLGMEPSWGFLGLLESI